VDKARAFIKRGILSGGLIGQALGLNQKYKIRLEGLGRNKNSTLLETFVNYVLKHKHFVFIFVIYFQIKVTF
jgi:hypothetical protein